MTVVYLLSIPSERYIEYRKCRLTVVMTQPITYDFKIHTIQLPKFSPKLTGGALQYPFKLVLILNERQQGARKTKKSKKKGSNENNVSPEGGHAIDLPS